MEIKIILTEGQIAQVLTDNKQNSQQGPETYSIMEPQKIESVRQKFTK
jgi:hypothetical protein